jgi:tRNA(Ile)-lysidine synthetase-like protein
MPPEENTIAVAVLNNSPPGGWQLKAEARDLRTPIETTPVEFNIFEVAGCRKPADPLVLRARRRGDRFEPLGLSGHSQKLSDLFVNEKLPVRARDRWPLLCDGELIAWVPGFRPAERCRLRRQTRRAIRLELSRAA